MPTESLPEPGRGYVHTSGQAEAQASLDTPEAGKPDAIKKPLKLVDHLAQWQKMPRPSPQLVNYLSGSSTCDPYNNLDHVGRRSSYLKHEMDVKHYLERCDKKWKEMPYEKNK